MPDVMEAIFDAAYLIFDLIAGILFFVFFMAVAKEQIRQIISENNINSVADIYTLLKDSFKDILQELMEVELDATLGYEKNHKGDLQTIKEMVILQKT